MSQETSTTKSLLPNCIPFKPMLASACSVASKTLDVWEIS